MKSLINVRHLYHENIPLNTEFGSKLQIIENHFYFCPKNVAAIRGVPPKSLADPDKRLSMHDLIHLNSLGVMTH